VAGGNSAPLLTSPRIPGERAQDRHGVPEVGSLARSRWLPIRGSGGDATRSKHGGNVRHRPLQASHYHVCNLSGGATPHCPSAEVVHLHPEALPCPKFPAHGRPLTPEAQLFSPGTEACSRPPGKGRYFSTPLSTVPAIELPRKGTLKYREGSLCAGGGKSWAHRNQGPRPALPECFAQASQRESLHPGSVPPSL
jgi:hypothetical protein